MSDDSVTIEVDGKSLPARKGQMLIEVTDANDIYVPRFCYHPKLTVAANCRMCLVEVEKAPKPLPACATPVMDGMKVSTRSEYARNAQKSVMEFLLINHPLDCPICDQGGECELQDLAMGYGADVSRYQEKKRVVKDKNIGPLVQTDMTRCIHCTRCVRFGEEIAGLRELGATGRGENMEIGTYVEKSMVSELSGNVIDVCPVGALTSKPFRFSARTWEMTQQPGIAPHDGLGSNIHFHIKGDMVKRVVPAQNEAINEVWLSDRDRYSYEGMHSDSRLTTPMVKENGEWKEVDWSIAFDRVRERLRQVVDNDPQQLGALLSPVSTTEEAFLLQKLVRGLGSHNIDHRLHQSDFSGQDNDPVYPALGLDVAELENRDAVLVIGGNPRKQQPLLNLRLRKAALKGAAVMFVNPYEYDLNYQVATSLVVSPMDMAVELAAILKAVLENNGAAGDDVKLPSDIKVNDNHRQIADALARGEGTTVLAGNLFISHPDFAILRYLASQIASLTGSSFGYLGESANDTGAWLVGAVPHRGTAGHTTTMGMQVVEMLEAGLKAYVLMNLDPELDIANGRLALESLEQAETVVALTAYRTESLDRVADVLLPVSIYAENEGTLYNISGIAQTFTACVPARGEARPAWKVLRVLANDMGVAGCEYQDIGEIQAELNGQLKEVRVDQPTTSLDAGNIRGANAKLVRYADIPMNSVDMLVRHAAALQQTPDIADGYARLPSALAERLGLADGDMVQISQDGSSVQMQCLIDEHLADNTVYTHAGHPLGAGLGPWYGEVTVSKV